MICSETRVSRDRQKEKKKTTDVEPPHCINEWQEWMNALYQTALETYLRCEGEVCFRSSLLNGACRPWWWSNLLAIRCRKGTGKFRFDYDARPKGLDDLRYSLDPDSDTLGLAATPKRNIPW